VLAHDDPKGLGVVLLPGVDKLGAIRHWNIADQGI
jgi:hypothetical protein